MNYTILFLPRSVIDNTALCEPLSNTRERHRAVLLVFILNAIAFTGNYFYFLFLVSHRWPLTFIRKASLPLLKTHPLLSLGTLQCA